MIKEQIVKIVKDTIPNSNADIHSWQSVLDQSDVNPFYNHLFSTIEYYVSYMSEHKSANVSFVVYSDKEAVGILPLMVHQDEHRKWVLSSNSVEVVEPIFVPTLARKVKKKIERQMAECIYALSKFLEIESCQFTNLEYSQLSDWYLFWAEKSNEIHSTHHLLVDLSLPLEEIRLNFRKSYRPLVTKGLREWKVEVHESLSDETFKRFRLLHAEVSGRSTRVIESWNEQKKQIDSLEAFLVTVSDGQNQMIGAGFFVYASYQGLYGVGAYKRELFDKPISHVVQMKAIETLKKNGVLWYEIGQKHLKADKTSPSDKELSISYFKEGFASVVMARQHLTVKLVD